MSTENYSADQGFQDVNVRTGKVEAVYQLAVLANSIRRAYLGVDHDNKPVHAGDVCCHMQDDGDEGASFIIEWEADEFAYQVRYDNDDVEMLLEYNLSEIRVLGNCWMIGFKEWQK